MQSYLSFGILRLIVPFIKLLRVLRRSKPALKFNGYLGLGKFTVFVLNVSGKDGKFTVFSKGGRENTGMEAISWIKKCVDLGAGEVVVNSIDTDGVKKGFDLEMLQAVCDAVNVPVIASGGAGSTQDFVTLFQQIPTIDAGLAASVFHFGEIQIPQLKATLKQNGITVRL